LPIVIRSPSALPDPNGAAGRNGRHADIKLQPMADVVADIARFRSRPWPRTRLVAARGAHAR
jgi:hypothetical protein